MTEDKCHQSTPAASLQNHISMWTRFHHLYSQSYFVCAFVYKDSDPFQISYTNWPSDIIHGDFYDMYISGRPYEQRYVTLKNLDRNNISDLDLHMLELLVKKNFLSAYITSHLNVQEYRDTPKLTMSSYLSQFGATANFWAGVTVIVVVEIIEAIYEVISGKCKSNKTDAE